MNVPERTDIPENIKEQLIVNCILSNNIKKNSMAILSFQKPDKVIMLEADDKHGKFEFRPLDLAMVLL